MRINLLGKEPFFLDQILFHRLERAQAVTGEWIVEDEISPPDGVLFGKSDRESDGRINVAIDM